MNSNERTYKATFLLDTRGKEDSVDEIIESLKEEISAIEAEVSGVEKLGKKDFVRTPDRHFTAGDFVEVIFKGNPSAPRQLHERLRLNKTVNRVMVQSHP